MTKARDISDLLDANGDVKSTALDNVPPSNDASALTTGTIDNARISLDANEIPSLDTAKITTGTFADARMPSTVLNSNVDLTNLSASNMTSGTLPDARFPATLPAVSGASLTNLPASGGTILQSNSAFKIDVQTFNFSSGRVVVTGLNVTLPNAVASNSKLFISGVLSAGGNANADPGVSPLWEYSTDNSTWQTIQRTTWQTSTSHAGTDSNSNVGNSMGYDGWGYAADIKHSAWNTMCSASDVSQARYYRVTVRETDNSTNVVRINGNYDNSQGFAPSGISSMVIMEIGA